MCDRSDAPPYVRPCRWPGGCPVADIPDHALHTDSAEECNARMWEVQGGSCGAPHEHHAYQPDPIHRDAVCASETCGRPFSDHHTEHPFVLGPPPSHTCAPDDRNEPEE